MRSSVPTPARRAAAFQDPNQNAPPSPPPPAPVPSHVKELSNLRQCLDSYGALTPTQGGKMHCQDPNQNAPPPPYPLPPPPFPKPCSTNRVIQDSAMTRTVRNAYSTMQVIRGRNTCRQQPNRTKKQGNGFSDPLQL